MYRQDCDLCGAGMESHLCKLTCPNCGARWDCSDLFEYTEDEMGRRGGSGSMRYINGNTYTEVNEDGQIVLIEYQAPIREQHIGYWFDKEWHDVILDGDTDYTQWIVDTFNPVDIEVMGVIRQWDRNTLEVHAYLDHNGKRVGMTIIQKVKTTHA